MNQLLFDRSIGNVRPILFARAQLKQQIHAIQLAPRIRFDGGGKETPIHNEPGERDIHSGNLDEATKLWSHQAGVNALAIDIENRLLISGGSDSSIKLWDLQEYPAGYGHIFKHKKSIARTASSHRFGITHLSFYPFDSAAFLSSSYDHHLKLYAAETLTIAADFDLGSIIYTHALSPIADHLLVACATQHPAVRLIDLRSGASTHSLAGHSGALLAVSWSPVQDHILASGGVDGSIRLWDIRKSSSSLGLLDFEDSTGIPGTNGMGKGARMRNSGKAHSAAVNGLTFTSDGSYLISAGHDDRVRVWDIGTGANTLASFGPLLKNSHLSKLPILVSPSSLAVPGKEILFFPNEKEILVFEMHEGRLLKRLKVPGPITSILRSRIGERNTKNRITALVWKGQAECLYSAHTDGQIRAWMPRTLEDEMIDKEDEDMTRVDDLDMADEAQKKRKVLDDVFKDLTSQKITFGYNL